MLLSAGLFTSCLNNSLDAPTAVDCSTSTLDFTITPTDANCGKSDGSIEISATGGEPPYQYAIDGGANQTGALFENLPAGNYAITVTDGQPCTKTLEITVGNVNGVQASANITFSGCGSSNGSISVQASNGTEPYQYQLDGGTMQTSNQFTGLSAKEYEVVITDAAGCDFSVIKTITTGVSYNATIKSIIANSCATTGCHNGTQNPDLRTLVNIQSRADRIKARTQAKTMPKGGSLTQQQIDAIACWVDDGALDN